MDSFELEPLHHLTRFRHSNIKSEVYLVTEDVCIKCHGILLAARSAKLENMLEESEKIKVVEFSDNMAGLKDCLDLIYGGSVDIWEENCKSIYKFGKLFQIQEMMDGVLSWIALYVTYDKFWKVYLELKDLHDDTLVFVDTLKIYFSVDCDNILEHAAELCRSEDNNTITAVVQLLSRIDDIRVLSVMEDLIDTATKNNETLAVASSSIDPKIYLQTVVSSTITYIENYLKSGSCDESDKSRCKQTLQKVLSICTNVETLQAINKILFDTNFQPSFSGNFADQSIKDLNWERVKQLTSPTTSHDAIKDFTEKARTKIHPCVVLEIVLKWWRVRTDREHVDMSFITPLITKIENVSSHWYKDVCRDERYKGLVETLDIPAPTEIRHLYYDCITKPIKFNEPIQKDCISKGYGAPVRLADMPFSHITKSYVNFTSWVNSKNKHNLMDCISKGDGTLAQLECLEFSDNMEGYKQRLPAFRFNAAVFPPYGVTKYHWYLSADEYNRDTSSFRHASLITDSKDEMLNFIDNEYGSKLHFVPPPDTLQ